MLSLISPLLSILQAEDKPDGLPWWSILLLLLILFVIIVWALARNVKFSEQLLIKHGHEDKHGNAHKVEMPAQDLSATPQPAAVKPDDLKIIEGIGPKIERLLNEAGIFTFAQLASTEIETLHNLMQKANLRIADPGSWPEQAALAAKGDLEGLKTLQDSLRGGRKIV